MSMQTKPSAAILETYAYLRAVGIMVPAKESTVPQASETEFSLEDRDAMSRAFDAGNYANAYETEDLETALADFNGGDAEEGTIGFNRADCERFAFILGFFSSYSLGEISDREAFDEAYNSDAGYYVVHVAKYCDDRTDEYLDEESEFSDEEI